LEANPAGPDAEIFDFSIPTANVGGPQVVSVGGTDPTDYSLATTGYVLSNNWATFYFSMVGGVLLIPFAPGTGTQYLITLPGFDVTDTPTGGPTARYQPNVQVSTVIGFAESITSGGTPAMSLSLRVSPVDYSGNGVVNNPYLEAYDNASGNLWGPAYPYAWGAFGDTILSGMFQLPLRISLLDSLVPKPNP
jgi:hypothetical protein